MEGELLQRRDFFFFFTAQDCFLTTGHIYLNEGRSVGQEDKTHKYRSRSAV